MPITNERVLKAALKGLEIQQLELNEDIHQVQNEIAQLSTHRGPGRPKLSGMTAPTHIPPTTDAPAGKRKVSAAARKKMAAAQKARWERKRAEIAAVAKKKPVARQKPKARAAGAA